MILIKINRKIIFVVIVINFVVVVANKTKITNFTQTFLQLSESTISQIRVFRKFIKNNPLKKIFKIALKHN